MPDQLHIHDDIKLYSTADKFYLEPTIDPDQILVIDRISGAATVHDYGTVKIPIPENCYKPVCGFLGTIKLISGYYLVVAKYRSLVGKVNGHDVYQLAGHELMPYARSTNHLTNRQIEDNSTYERMINTALETPGIYFSYGHDMTHTLQRLHSVDSDFHKLSMAARADSRFLWNSYLLKDFLDQTFARWALPIIQGFVSINRITVQGHQLSWTLVSRRSIERAGTRLFIRGVDAQGNVANYVETEQIVENGPDKSSFVQTRGSIPLFWHQYPNLRLKPGITVVGTEHLAAYTTHLRDQLQRYGNQVLVNLIDQCGREQALEAGYRAAVAAAALPGVRYEPFDFHTECRRMRYDRLDILMHRVQHELTEFGYFVSRGGSVLRRQSGVFRTNCVDCLDRTNVVQSMLANTTLKSQLSALTVGHSTGQVPLPDEIQRLFNGVWADHADMISTQYSGTGALKTDFTRTGKRTAMGALMDGVNSLTRYYKNNFCDGFRQDSIDLFLGKYVVVDGEGNTIPSPLRRNRDWKYVAVPSFMVVALGMFCASATLPSRYDSAVLLYLMFWGACLSLTLNYILKNGSDYVEWPRLDGGGVATTRAHGLTTSL